MKLIPVLSSVIVSLGIAGFAHAENPPGAGPTTGSWSVQLRYEDTTTSSDTGVVLGLSGFQLGLGNRITDRWYVGATGELQLADNVGDVDHGFSKSLRAGLESRYVFHQGTGAVSTNGDDGPFVQVPRYDWIGVRGGVQTVNGARGSFAELELGGDVWSTSSAQLGLFVALGVNVEPVDTYGVAHRWDSQMEQDVVAPAADPSATAVSPYLSFGLDVAYD